MFKRNWRSIVIGAVCAAVVCATIILYTVFTSNHIFNESASHLSEIYMQVNARFSQQVNTNRGLMSSWGQYIHNSVNIINGVDGETDEEKNERRAELQNFMKVQQEQWKFTDFYFVGVEETVADGDTGKYKNRVHCVNLDGEETVFRFRRSQSEWLGKEGGGVVGIKEGADANSQIMLFSVDVEQCKFDGFDYTAIGISFDEIDMADMLDIEVFGADGICYIVLPDGNVLLQTGGTVRRDNYLDYLSSDNANLSGKTVADIRKDWKDQKTDTILFTNNENGYDYYLTYIPVGFGDWMLLGLAPSDVVNASMSWFRTVTIIVMAAIFIAIGAVVVWLMITTNKRRVKEKELEVKSRENMLDLLTVNSNDMFILFSPETFAADYVSSNIERVFGLDINAVRKDIRNILKAAVEEHDELNDEWLADLPKARTWQIDTLMRNVMSGEEYWYHISLDYSAFNGKDGYVMMFSDRSKERKMNENLKEALSIAKSANDAKSNFLANMSHDIRTPMNAIIGFATLLAKDADKPDKVREYVRKISFSGQHLLSLINDILDMSKIESGKTSLNMVDFNLSEFLEELYAMMASQTKAKNQSFEVRTKGRMPELVTGDKLRLNQILLNLLSNAVKYTPAGGNIELNIESMPNKIHNHEHLRFEVKDNGIGMSEEFVNIIFEPFSRETTGKTREIQGTGLGMAITKNIVNLMGGTISVESKLGKGSSFVVELELAEAGKNAGEDKEFWANHNVTRVLVVDDEEDICIEVRDLMSDTGVNVDYALSGKSAVKMVSDAYDSDNAFHIVLLDWKMPEMDGVETARRIRKKVGNDVPIMVLTSYNFDEIEDDAKAAGIDCFLPKPFFVSNFRHAISRLREGDTKEMASVPDKISLAGLKVLAAEDNEINAEILLELLDIEEVKCDIACNGKEALEKFEASEPGQYDMIFMDVQMPIMNGYESARAIRGCAHEEAKTIPIIAMTANAFDDDVKSAFDAGMNAHLAKPIDMDKLKIIIAKLREGKND